MLKKIPSALLFLAAVLVMTLSGTAATLSAEAAETATIWDSIGRIANFIIALGPIILTVLVIINTIKPVVGQIGGIVCLILAVAYGYRTFVMFDSMQEYLTTAETVDAQAVYMIETFLSGIVFALLFWLSGAKIQDEEVTGLFVGVGTIGCLLLALVAFSGASSGIMPLNVIPTILLIMAAKRLPPVFVPDAVPRGITVKTIVITAVVVVAYFVLPSHLV